ncbi:MAG: lysostaphin resistance A-like protein [Candidatus Methanofastidiosia archaeon]
MEKNALTIIISLFLLTSEITFIKNLRLGLVLYSFLLAFLMLSLLYLKLERTLRKLLTVIMLLPLTRIVSSAMPLSELNFQMRISLVYSIVFLSAFLIFYNLKISFSELGYSLRGFKFLPSVILLGSVLGFVEYHILKPEVVIEPVNTINVATALLVFIVFTGYVEEMIFRGMIQNLSEKIWRKEFALVFSNVLFGIMHIVWQSPVEIVFVFSVGMLLGIIFFYTRNLFLVSVIHGVLNFFLFVIWPMYYQP